MCVLHTVICIRVLYFVNDTNNILYVVYFVYVFILFVFVVFFDIEKEVKMRIKSLNIFYFRLQSVLRR